MSSLNMEVFQSFLSALEGEALAWGKGSDGYEQIRERAEKNRHQYDHQRKYYHSLADYLIDLEPEDTEGITPSSPVDNLSLGIGLLTNFAYITATKHSRNPEEANVNNLLQLFGKPATLATIAEPSYFSNHTRDRKNVAVAAMYIEGSMGILPSQDELDVEIALQKYQITEDGVVFNDFPSHTSVRKEKSRCPANKFFGQMLGNIATICAKDPLLFQRTIDQNQRQTGIIIPSL